MVQREKRSRPRVLLLRPLAKQSRRRHHHRLPIEGHRHCPTKGVALSLRFLRLPVGQPMSKRSIGRTSQLKTNKRFLHGLTSFLPVIWMGHRLPMYILYPSPQRVQLVPPHWRQHDACHHFLLAVLERVKTRALTALTPKTK